MKKSIPEWFSISEEATAQVMERISKTVSSNSMALQVKSSPMLAHWFMLDSLLLANQANREGMHAIALALTRQCVESMGVIELGICKSSQAEAMLIKWDNDRLTPGKLRAWLQDNVWVNYGLGLWNEPWHEFMREFIAAIQPYAHYGRDLAQWQLRLHGMTEGETLTGIVEIFPRAYDAR